MKLEVSNQKYHTTDENTPFTPSVLNQHKNELVLVLVTLLFVELFHTFIIQLCCAQLVFMQYLLQPHTGKTDYCKKVVIDDHKTSSLALLDKKVHYYALWERVSLFRSGWWNSPVW